MTTKRSAALLLAVLFLVSCVAPAPGPLRSPLAFDSPVPAPEQRVYLPLVATTPNKKGVSLACGYEDMPRMAREVAELGVSWVWNWRTDPVTFPGVESVPCIWSGVVIGQPLGGTSAWVIGFNEPDMTDQANMAPEQAALEWLRMEATYHDRKLTSPQVVVPGGRWLEEWYAAYQDQNGGRAPRMDAIAIHTYYGNDLVAYQEQVRYYIALAEKWGVNEVWVTEFALSPGLDRTLRETLDDTAAYVAWLAAQPTVTRFAVWTNRVECGANITPDGIFDTPLYAANGVLTEAGKLYQILGGQ